MKTCFAIVYASNEPKFMLHEILATLIEKMAGMKITFSL